jgi:sarcosine oxidase subunit gamma
VLEHRGIFDGHPDERRLRAIDGVGIRVTVLGGRGLLLLQGDPVEAAVRKALQDGERPSLPGPGEVSFGARSSLVWLAPKEWLLELPRAELESVYAEMTDHIKTAHAAVTDVSEAYVCFELSGNRAVSVLATGCSLDLHRNTFGVARAARTLLADVPVILFRCREFAVFRCLVDRTYAEHLWSWLETSPAVGSPAGTSLPLA